MVERNLDELKKLAKLYAEMMGNELGQNMYKGSWEANTVEEAVDEIKYHVQKLESAAFYGNEAQVKEYAADVGNQTMILLNILGYLDPDDYVEPKKTQYKKPAPSSYADYS